MSYQCGISVSTTSVPGQMYMYMHMRSETGVPTKCLQPRSEDLCIGLCEVRLKSADLQTFMSSATGVFTGISRQVHVCHVRMKYADLHIFVK